MLAIIRGRPQPHRLHPVRLNTTSFAEPSFDFALLQQSTPHHAGRNRIALLWLFGLLAGCRA